MERYGFPNFFSYLDNSIWNVDNSATIAGQGDSTTGVLDVWTTGSDSNWTPGTPATTSASGSGSALTGGAGTWTGTVVNFGNVGAAWTAFDGTPYTEKFITVNGTAYSPPPPQVPVPAAVWLFGSGLVGLVGVARRKNSWYSPRLLLHGMQCSVQLVTNTGPGYPGPVFLIRPGVTSPDR